MGICRTAARFAFAALALLSTDAFAFQDSHKGMNAPTPQEMTLRRTNKEHLRDLRVGMPRSEMLEKMGGHEPKMYYNLFQETERMSNPYKAVPHKAQGRSFDVYYFWTDVLHPDGNVTDDECTPVIVEKDQVLGWGWERYKALIGEPAVSRIT